MGSSKRNGCASYGLTLKTQRLASQHWNKNADISIETLGNVIEKLQVFYQPRCSEIPRLSN
jgi:hypothetical protein